MEQESKGKAKNKKSCAPLKKLWILLLLNHQRQLLQHSFTGCGILVFLVATGTAFELALGNVIFHVKILRVLTRTCEGCENCKGKDNSFDELYRYINNFLLKVKGDYHCLCHSSWSFIKSLHTTRLQRRV